MPFHFNSSKAEEKVTDILKIFSFFRIIISYFDFFVKKSRPKTSGGKSEKRIISHILEHGFQALLRLIYPA